MDIVVTVTADRHYDVATESARHAIHNRSWRKAITPDLSTNEHRRHSRTNYRVATHTATTTSTTTTTTTTTVAPSMGGMTSSRKRGVGDGREEEGEGPMDLQEVERETSRRRCKTRSESSGTTSYLEGTRK